MPRPPVGSTETKDLTKQELRVELNGKDWKETAQALAIKLLKLSGVTGATIGKEGLITLELEDGKQLDEKSVKKHVKESGYKFKSLREPGTEPEEIEEEPVAVD